jgi:hypothetical protein
MADQRILASEEMVGASHATKADTLNRLALVEHNTDGTHNAITPATVNGQSLATTAGPTFAHAHLTDAIADNTATNQGATTAFAKSEDAVLRRSPDQAVNLVAGAVAAMSRAHSAVFTNTTNSGGVVRSVALPSWTPAANQIIYQKLTGGAGVQLEIVATTGVIRLTLNATAYNSTVPGGGAASNLLAGSRHRIAAYYSVGATQTTVTVYLDGVLLSTPAAQNNVDLTNTAVAYFMGTSAATYAGIDYGTEIWNSVPTATEERLLYLKDIAYADKWGSQVTLNTDTIITTGIPYSTFSGASATGLTAARSGAGEAYAQLMPTTAYKNNKRFRVKYDLAVTSGTPPVIKEIPSAGYLAVLSAGTGNTVEFSTTGAGSVFYIAHLAGETANFTISNIVLTKIGATLALQPENAMVDKWYDSSSNGLDATYPTAGCTLTRPVSKRVKQPTPTAETTGAVTLTIAKLLTGIITGAPSDARAYTLDTGANIDAIDRFDIGDSFEWTLINTETAANDHTITVTAATGHTIIGNPTVLSAHADTIKSSSGTFRTVKTAASTYVSYRIA